MLFRTSSFMILLVLFFSSLAHAELIENSANSADGIPISYHVQGEGDPALVFIHAWTGNQELWNTQREFFAQKYKVITLDLAGHGSSGQERTEWTIEAFGNDVASVLHALELQKVILIGHAMGASAAIEAARQLPEQVIGIVGIDTMQNLELVSTVEQQERILSRFRKDYTALTTQIVQNMFSPGSEPALVEKITQEMLSVPEEIGIPTIQASMSYELASAVQSLSLPIRCINSDVFPTNVQGNKQYAKSYEVVIVPESGHLFFLESPDEFNQILGNVLQEIVAYNAQEAEAKVAE